MAAGKFCENNLQDLTPLVSQLNKLLVSLDIGQHNAIEIFAVKWNVVSEISKVLLNDIFTELDESSGIKNIITDRLNLGELQVDEISGKVRYGRKYKEIYTNQVNQTLSRCFFCIFSENCGGEGGINSFSTVDHAGVVVVAGFYEFHFIFKEQNS